MTTEEMIAIKEKFLRGNGKQELHPKRRMLHMIRRIHDRMERDGNAKLKERDLTLAQGHALGFLFAHGGNAPLKDLEKALNVAQSTSQGIVSRLEKRGYITTNIDPQDKRIKIASITQSGLSAMSFIGETMHSLESEITASLSKEECETFTKLLAKIVGEFDNKNCK